MPSPEGGSPLVVRDSMLRRAARASSRSRAARATPPRATLPPPYAVAAARRRAVAVRVTVPPLRCCAFVLAAVRARHGGYRPSTVLLVALSPAGVTQPTDADERGQLIVDVLVEAFSELMAADADAFRTKFRKMAADPFAFYRGSACLFYADMESLEDRWCDERTSRVWIQGDLHAENFGTYMDSAGRIVFDVNDFDEAYLGHLSWDLRRFAASFALMAWRKALSDDAIGELIAVYLRSYLDQVEAFTRSDEDRAFALVKNNTEGAVHEVILETATRTRQALLDRITVVEEHERRFADRSQNRRLEDPERDRVRAAL